ncbi:MAG: glycoside hydrolase family 3 N-terminal domain-containing protein [Thermodesulfobacteriota bacterium]
MNDRARRELVGRLLLVGFEGEVFDRTLERLLLEVRPAGIILFQRNTGGGPAQVAGLLDRCQDLARAELDRPLLTAIDQEGGPVRRLGPPFTQAPSQREMAGRMSVDEVRVLSEACGRELAAVGLNLNLAPVLDVVTEAAASYMTERTFSGDPHVAGAYGRAVIQGHARSGVLTCAKHFPGIGDVRQDPHYELPLVGHSTTRLKTLEALPFALAVAEGVPAVMTSHVLFRGLDEDHPATFSSRIVTDYLRGELGFNGLALTDDLEMGAVVKHYSIGPAAVRAVLAGGDLLLICRREDRIREAAGALYEAARSGELPAARIEESSARLQIVLEQLVSFPRTPFEEVFHLGA